MNKAIAFAAVTTVAAALALPAFAQGTPRVDQRQANQDARIDNGVASGNLTGREAARLEAGQAKVDAIEANAKADGVVTRKERARLHQAQEVQSKRIYAQKHDRQRDRDHNGVIDRRQ